MAIILPTLPMGGFAGTTPEQQQIWWQEVVAAIQAQEARQDETIDELADIVADLQEVIRNDAITSSYTAPGTVLSAADAGADATVTIIAHDRIYGDISDVEVDGGSITGLPYSAIRYVYYDDPDREGGAVTYVATDDANTALPTAASGRHFVGKVTTPASGGGATSGGTTSPSGGGTIDRGEIGSKL